MEKEHQDQLIPIQMQYLTSFTLMYVDCFKFHHLVERNTVTFTDEFSHYMWILFLRQKSEVFSAFMKFKFVVETITDRKIKSFQSD
jgi:hypothetical protein